MSSQYFSQSYLEARKRFMDRVAKSPQKSREWTRSFGQAAGEELTTNAALLKSPKFDEALGRRLFVVTSGLHGVEGYCGSAIQLGIIDDWSNKLPSYDLLLIHGVNPFGFHYKRRVNKDNIDLNRNATLAGDPRDNPGYDRVRHLFNPGKPLAGKKMAQMLLMARILGHAAISKKTVKAAFLSGQYIDPKGPFYGGKETAAEVINVGDILEELSADYDVYGHLDLHTGYGIRGQAHLLCHSNQSRKAWSDLGFSPEPEDDGADYHMSGNLLSYLEDRLKTCKADLLYRSVLLEFGTKGMDLRHHLDSMRIMISDNTMGTRHNPSEEFLEMFNPSCPRWRHDVVEQGMRLLRRMNECVQKRPVPATA
ncbi:MAG: M14 family metallopeptidase [Planctomycetota bacterium]|nr:M14 family metallopeptidase [Planctomycetota bacterium]